MTCTEDPTFDLETRNGKLTGDSHFNCLRVSTFALVTEIAPNISCCCQLLLSEINLLTMSPDFTSFVLWCHQFINFSLNFCQVRKSYEVNLLTMSPDVINFVLWCHQFFNFSFNFRQVRKLLSEMNLWTMSPDVTKVVLWCHQFSQLFFQFSPG